MLASVSVVAVFGSVKITSDSFSAALTDPTSQTFKDAKLKYETAVIQHFSNTESSSNLLPNEKNNRGPIGLTSNLIPLII